MFDVITFGSATKDIFLKVKKEDFKLGRKILIDDKIELTGGGGTNTACTLSSLGFKVAYCGMVGKDREGVDVLKDLKRFKVNRSLIKKRDKTAYSLILSLKTERTIFVLKGASHFMTKNDVPWSKLKTKWFYICPLYDKTALLFKPLLKFAKEKDIKVALNLGKEQIRLGKVALKPLLKDVDVLLVNEHEAKDIASSMKELVSLCPGIVVITKGKKGSLVFDKERLFDVKSNNSPFVERTGAGDAFGSGFVAGLLKKNSIEYAIKTAVSNAESCITEIGAKEGLLKSFNNLKKVEYEIKNR